MIKETVIHILCPVPDEPLVLIFISERNPEKYKRALYYDMFYVSVIISIVKKQRGSSNALPGFFHCVLLSPKSDRRDWSGRKVKAECAIYDY